MDTSHIVFFFGSGVSIPSGMPTVNEITDMVFDKPFERTPTGRYTSATEQDNDVDKIKGFLRVIRCYAQATLQASNRQDQNGKREINYEDLFYLCRMIRDDQFGPLPNLAIRPFSEKIRADAGSFLIESRHRDMNDLAYTADEASWLISGAVRKALDKPVDDKKLEKSFKPLLDAIADDDVDQVAIVTLNHDLLVEYLMKIKDIKYVDGFGSQSGDLRFLKPIRLFEEDGKVALIKPHGSINWYIVHREDQGFTQAQYATYSGNNLNNIRDDEGQKYKPRSFEPTILTDSGKEEYYQTDIIGEMIETFHHSLRQTSVVIESGFGWEDQGIYDSLQRYLNREDENILLLLHPEDDFHEYHPINLATMTLSMPGLTKAVPEFMCNTSWDEIKRTLRRF